MIRAERNRPADRIVAGVIAVATVGLFGAAWLFSDARQATLHTATEPIANIAAPAKAPERVNEIWRAPTLDRKANQRPIVADGAVFTESNHGISALDAETGKVVWDYQRQRELCGTSAAWNKVITVFRGAAGCGDVVAFDAQTGNYTDTRSAVSAENVAMLSSNSRVGTVSDQRLELWRSDLVRTVEYGRVESPNEPKAQPRQGCRIQSALTRTELLAVVDTCPVNGGRETSLRFGNTTPEDSREPDELASVPLNSESAVLVGISQTAAVVYIGGDQPMLQAVGSDGTVLSETKVAHSPAADAYLASMIGKDLPDPGPGVSKKPSVPAFLPVSGDLPHQVTWFDGNKLYAFDPVKLRESFTVEDALGPGAAFGDDLLFPVRNGLLVADKNTGETKRTIPVDRGDYSGQVSVAVSGKTIIEQRGAELVALS